MSSAAAASSSQRDAEIADRGGGGGAPLISDQDLAQRSGRFAPLFTHPGFEHAACPEGKVK
jgi:hypothetical protein